MSILRANLKHLYQCRMMWVWYLLVLCQTPWVFMPFISKSDRYLGYLIISLFMGMLVGGIQKDVLSKPLSFCLPRHRGVTRRVIFWVGCILNMFLGCVFFGYSGLEFPYVLLVVLAGSFVGMVFYLWGVNIGLVKLPSAWAGIAWLVIFGAWILKWDVVLQNMIVDGPLVVILVSVIICVWVWRVSGRDVLARKYCGELVLSMFDGWGLEKKLKYQQMLADKNLTEGRVKLFDNIHEFILGRMNRYEYLSRGRYVWGNIYAAFGKVLGIKRKRDVLMSLLIFVCLIAWFGYLEVMNTKAVNVLMILPVFIALGIDLLPHRSMLFPAGRGDRYYSSVVLAIVITVLAVLLGLVLVGVSNIMEMALPEISLRGKMLNFHGIEISEIYICFLFIPVILSIVTITGRMNLLKFALVIGLINGWTGFEMAFKGTLVEVIGVTGVTGLIAIFWIVFLVILRYVCMRRSLVGQGR